MQQCSSRVQQDERQNPQLAPDQMVEIIRRHLGLIRGVTGPVYMKPYPNGALLERRFIFFSFLKVLSSFTSKVKRG